MSEKRLSPAELSRYSRHILLDEIGVTGQQRLAESKVLIIGAGGLGSPAALYLAAAGIGTLGIADLDSVESHNLQRQLLHDTKSIGIAKVTSAASRLRSMNPHVRIVEHQDGITVANAAEIFLGYDILVDATDNFTARYINNDAAVAAGKPLVFASVFKFEGQLTLFDTASGGPCYRCLFPQQPDEGMVPGCGEAGVVGALCGMIGSLQALEVIKYLLRIGESLSGKLCTYSALSHQWRTITLKRSPNCVACGDRRTGRTVQEKSETYKASSTSSLAPSVVPLEVSVEETSALLRHPVRRTTVLDVREPWECEICQIEGSTFIPMRQIPERYRELPQDTHLLVLCHHGSRSLQVTQFLRNAGLEFVSNIAGGVSAWADRIDASLQRY
jgi:adenylyltransferase/sulfurtransferase